MEHVFSLKIAPNGFLYASVLGKGLYRSADSGSSWLQINPFLADEWSVEVNPLNELIASQRDSGMYFSNDNGNSWNRVSNELQQGTILAASTTGNFFAESGGELFRSTNKGKEWWSLKTFGGSVAFDNAGKMYAGKGEKIISSSNNGTSWTNVDSTLKNIYSLVVLNNGAIVAGTFYDSTTSASIYLKKSVDSAWIQTGPSSTINLLVKDSLGNVYAATHDKGIYKSTDGGMVWTAMNKGLTTPKVYSFAIDNAGFVYAGTADGVFRSSITFPALPVELVLFNGTVRGKQILLSWITATEVSNAGFEIERSEKLKVKNEKWEKIGFVEGEGTSNIQHQYSFTDFAAQNRKSFYRLKQIDRNGSFSYSESIEIITSLVAEDYTLSQNFPNPFNPITTLHFAVKSTEHAHVKVYSAIGKEISVLFDGVVLADNYYTVTFDGSGLPSGTYFCAMRIGSKTEVRQMLLLK